MINYTSNLKPRSDVKKLIYVHCSILKFQSDQDFFSSKRDIYSFHGKTNSITPRIKLYPLKYVIIILFYSFEYIIILTTEVVALSIYEIVPPKV